MAKRYSNSKRQRQQKVVNQKAANIFNKNITGDINEDNILKEVIFTTIGGMKLKCFPVDDIIIESVRVNLEKEFEKEGLILDPPKITIESGPGMADIELELDDIEKCKTEDEEETNRRIGLYDEWLEVKLDFTHELNIRQPQAILVYGLGDESYYGFEQEGGLKLPEDFEEKMRPKIEALGQDWPDDHFGQMALYINIFILKQNVSDTIKASYYIQSTKNIGLLTVEKFEETMASADYSFRSWVEEQNNGTSDTSKEVGSGDSSKE